jgi:hypothetical protein
MSQPLDYDVFREGGDKGKAKNTGAGVLANRGLSIVSGSSYKSPVECPSCTSHIRPAHKDDVYKVDHRVNVNDKEEPISLVLAPLGGINEPRKLSTIVFDQTKEDGYFLSDLPLEQGPELVAEKKEGGRGRVGSEGGGEKKQEKMDFATRLYIGSLSIVGLYILFRMMYKRGVMVQ